MLPGTKLQVEIEQITEQLLPRDISGDIQLSVLIMTEKREHPFFISTRQKDQSRIWTSAIFLTR